MMDTKTEQFFNAVIELQKKAAELYGEEAAESLDITLHYVNNNDLPLFTEQVTANIQQHNGLTYMVAHVNGSFCKARYHKLPEVTLFADKK